MIKKVTEKWHFTGEAEKGPRHLTCMKQKNLFIHALTEKIIEYIAESFFIVSNLDEIFLI